MVETGEMPVEAQMVTDGLETNQPGSQDLHPGTGSPFTYVCVTTLVCIFDLCVLVHAHINSCSHTHRLIEFHNVGHISPGAISHHSDIVTLRWNNLAGISLKLHKVLCPSITAEAVLMW